MAEPLPHPELEQLLPAAALETLEGDELVLITAHVQECGNCRRLLESYRDVVATVATGLPDRPLDRARSAELRARLLARARGKASPAAPAQRSPGVVDRWAGWALAAGLAGLLLVHHAIHRPVAYGWLAAGLLVFVVLGLGAYIRVQRARLAALRMQLGVEQPVKLEVRQATTESRG
jgi:hypothetical protein